LGLNLVLFGSAVADMSRLVREAAAAFFMIAEGIDGGINAEAVPQSELARTAVAKT
jgi:hypothetical protein